ncbi:MAG TPA: ATP-binding cassette domain-containing protein [Candidatus Eisenbacteria bacterium]|nr:ATP-binding cassette domain-containing protein [Candidatus Eisenbacteria bacterium]
MSAAPAGLRSSGDVIVFDRVSYSIGGRPILENVSFTVSAGTTKVVMGPSGIGKSTILRLILGLIRPQSGDVIVLGRSIVKAAAGGRDEIRRKIGMVFQNGALFDSLTVGENVGYSLIEHGHIPIDEVEERVRTMLKRVGLDPDVLLDRLPDELSIGMQRRVAIARALASNDPQIMLYDEPTTGLDPVSVEMITDIIVRLRQELHVSSIVVTHEIPHALKVGNRFLFLYDRRVAFEGSASELAESNVPDLVRFLAPFKISLAQAFHSFGEGNGT